MLRDAFAHRLQRFVPIRALRAAFGMTTVSSTLVGYAQRSEAVLDRTLPPATQPPERLHQAMRYGVLGGGKRMRPMFVYATVAAFGAPLERGDASAAAVELIHAYSLIHDDLPAMDDDDLRRGRPTCHIRFDEATAILAGDALQALAFEVLARDANHTPATRVEMIRVLASACGAEGMAGGQAFDLAAVGTKLTPDALERMHVHKTGALIRASVRLGALSAQCGDEARLAQLDRYAHCVGLAFQIRDDILDVEGDTAVIGKQQGADIARDKPTYPAVFGLEASRKRAESLRTEAIECARAGATNPAELVDLANFSIDRNR